LAVVWLKAIVLLATPFALGGIAVSLALTRSDFPVGTLYGVDLLGAAAGCIAALALLTLMDAPSAMFLIAAAAAAAGWCFARADAGAPARDLPPALRWRVLGRPGLMAAALATLAVVNASVGGRGLQPVSAKYGTVENLPALEYVRWNSFSRVAVGLPYWGSPWLWGPSPRLPAGTLVHQRYMDIDGDAATSMPRYDGTPGAMDFLHYDLTNLAYHARHTGRAAIIGVGSGRDLLSAHVFGFRDITGVELNPIFVDLLVDPAKLRGYAGVADLPGVRLVVDDGRSWFVRTRERFDLIEMSMVDTFAATGAGAFSLSENGLYTVEAWKIFLSALRPDGLFTVSRWNSPNVPTELGRVTSLAVAALMELGIDAPRDHIFIAGVGSLATIVISRRPFAAGDLAALNEAARGLDFAVLASPDRPAATPILSDLLAARDAGDLLARAGGYHLDASPPTDARPFFFNQLRLTHPGDLAAVAQQWRRSGSLIRGAGVIAGGNLIALGTLLLVVVLSALVALVVILLPTRVSAHAQPPRLAFAGSGYFLLIGLGFMLVEIGVIQRISVFLGHPVYALSIGLFSIILSTGLGSLLSERFPLVRPRQLVAWLAALATYLLLLPEWLPAVTHSGLAGSGLVPRALVSIAAIFPAGLAMGFGFPTGMRLVTAIDARTTPWLWGVNGAAGVLAAGLAVTCSIGISIDATIRAGGACYLLLMPFALILLLRGRRPDPVLSPACLVPERR